LRLHVRPPPLRLDGIAGLEQQGQVLLPWRGPLGSLCPVADRDRNRGVVHADPTRRDPLVHGTVLQYVDRSERNGLGGLPGPGRSALPRVRGRPAPRGQAMSGRVIHTGQAIVDLSLRIPAVPSPGADVFASSHQICAGGGFNVMAAAARDGASVLYVGSHGTGHFGDLVRTAMAAEGIRVLPEPDRDTDTGFSIALVDDGAERSFISTLGAEGNVTPAQYHAAATASSDVVYVSGYSLLHPSNRAALLEWLPSLPAGTEVLADPSPVIAELDRDTLERLLPHVTIWSTNEPEARVLAERAQLDASASLEAITSELRQAWATTVICRRGAHSTLVAQAGQRDITRVP